MIETFLNWTLKSKQVQTMPKNVRIQQVRWYVNEDYN